TTPVGSFPPNPWGLYDLHGNVWEWCADHWHDSYSQAPDEGNAWLSPNATQSRILRGGSWYDLPRFCRCACRYGLRSDGRSNDVGFRVAV
ncbi:MAG: formylglycine-generating enzyme family protein, partial [Microcystaceae cyanobacterium]